MNKAIEVPTIAIVLAEIQIKHILKLKLLQHDSVCLVLSFTSASVHMVRKYFRAEELAVKIDAYGDKGLSI